MIFYHHSTITIIMLAVMKLLHLLLLLNYTINYTDKSCFRTPLDFCVVFLLSALYFSNVAP